MYLVERPNLFLFSVFYTLYQFKKKNPNRYVVQGKVANNSSCDRTCSTYLLVQIHYMYTQLKFSATLCELYMMNNAHM